jgi:predicted transposase/invertase (TIGR01784 family)
MVIGINPLIDYAFKLLFGSELRKSITIGFINAVLGGQIPVTDVTFPNTVHSKLSEDGKFFILDVLAEDALGRKFNIEVQIALPAGMAERMVFYTAETYVRRLQQGQNYTDLRPSISICVLAGALIRQPAKLHLDFRLREETLPITLTDDLQIHFLQLKHLQVTAETLYTATPIERWCWFFRHAPELTTEQVSQLLPDQEFTEAARVLEMISQTPEQLYEYNARVKAQRDEEARIIYAQQQGIEIGQQQGIEIGHAQGIKIGEARGIHRGLLQGQILQLQQLLKLPTCSDEQFAACDIDQLTQMLTQLQQQFKKQYS